MDGRVPVTDKLEQRAHGHTGIVSAPAGIGAFLFELLAADETGQQVEVAEVEGIEPVESFIGIEIGTAALNQIEHRFVQYRHRQFDGFAFARVTGFGLQGDLDGIARPVHLFLRPGGDDDFFIRVFHRNGDVTHTERRFAEVDVAFTQRFVHAGRDGDHGQIIAGNVVGLDRELNHRRAGFQGLHPAVDDAEAFDGDQGLGAGKGIFDQVAGGVADFIVLRFRDDLQGVVVFLAPHHPALADDPGVNLRDVRPAPGVFDAGGHAVRSRFLRRESAGGGFRAGGAGAVAGGDPLLGKLGEVGVARAFYAGGGGDFAFNLNVDFGPADGSAAFVDDDVVDFRRFVFFIKPVGVFEADKPVQPDKLRRSSGSDELSPVVTHGAFDH